MTKFQVGDIILTKGVSNSFNIEYKVIQIKKTELIVENENVVRLINKKDVIKIIKNAY